MKWMMRVFRLVLWLYPKAFRSRFAPEMEEVFRLRLQEAAAEGSLARFFLRELAQMPASLANVYLWSMRPQGEDRLALSGGGSAGNREAGWQSSFLAGLPHLLVGLLIGGVTLLSGVSPAVEKIANDWGWLQAALLALAAVGVGVYCLRKGWRSWAASWLVYLVFLPILFLITGIQLTPLEDLEDWIQPISWILLPLLAIYLLYKITCADRVRGLLAALPLAAIPWVFFEEFVPDVLRGLAWVWIFGLAFGAAALILRARRFRAALALALVVPVLGGLPFAYLGVYHGGTLPFSEPGPNLAEVFRQYLSFLTMTSSVILGPQLAARLRSLGEDARAESGVRYARLALGALLLVLVLQILNWSVSNSAMGSLGIAMILNFPGWLWPILRLTPFLLVVIAVILYLAGVVLLVLALLESGALSGDDRAGVKIAALAAVLPGVPISPAVAVMPPFFRWIPDLPPVLQQVAFLLWIVLAAWAAGNEVGDQQPYGPVNSSSSQSPAR